MKYIFSLLITIIAVGIFVPATSFAGSAQSTSNRLEFQKMLSEPHAYSFPSVQYGSLGTWEGSIISEVIAQSYSPEGLNELTMYNGILFGAQAMDLGFAPPEGTGDNLLAVEDNAIVSDYGPLTSSLTVSFISYADDPTAYAVAETQHFGLDIASSGITHIFLYDKKKNLTDSITTSSGFVGITTQDKISFVVLQFDAAVGSGLNSIIVDGKDIGRISSSENYSEQHPSQIPEGNQDGLQPNNPINNGSILGDATIAPGIVVGAQTGASPEVRLYSPQGELVSRFNAYEEHFTGGVQVGMGDIDGNGTTEIVTAPGKGSAPHIRIFDVTGKFITGFFAYDLGFQGGVNIAVGDIEGDGMADIVTAPKGGGGPNIRIFGWRDGTLIPTTENFFAYDLAFRGGVSVALGDIDGDGQKDIVNAPESGGGPHLRIFSFKLGIYRPSMLALMAYNPSFRGGVNVTAGDLDGDGYAEVITGTVNGGPHVRIFGYSTNARTLTLRNPGFMAFHSSLVSGVTVATADLDENGKDEIVATPRTGEPLIKFFDSEGQSVRAEFLGQDINRQSGLTIERGYLQ